MHRIPRFEEDDDTIVLPSLKPRNRFLNEALRSRSGGRMKSPKDRNRQKEKQQLRRMHLEDF